MRRESLKSRLKAGDQVFGTFVQLNDPAVVEIAGAAGLDFVIIDTEHSAKDLFVVENMVRAAESFDISAIIRPHSDDERTISRLLETGAEGMMIPFVESADDVARARSAMSYPPAGGRGTCSVTRAGRYGDLRPIFAEHVAHVNDELLLVGLIESEAGVENIQEIIAAGVDVAFLGRGDLASALGVHGQAEHPHVRDAVEKVLAAFRTSGSTEQWCGIMPYAPEESLGWYQQGVNFLAYSVDTFTLFKAYRGALEAAKPGAEFSGRPTRPALTIHR